MRLKIKYLLSCLALLLILPACKDNADVEEATLELSTQALTFSKEGAVQTVTVSTNKDSWSAFSVQEDSWIGLTQEGNTLKVKVPANPQGQDRTTSIIVNAGGLQRRISVRQSGAEASLEAEGKVVFTAEGGTKLVAFKSNVTKVEIELAVPSDWLSIEERTSSSFTLVAKKNTEKTKRTAKVNLTLGTTIKEIDVEQEGNSPYVMPLLDFPSDLYTVIRYEQSRGNILLKTEEGAEEEPSNYRFITKSKVFPFIQYEFSTPLSPGFSLVTLLCLDQTLTKDNADFEAYLADYGFTRTKGDDRNVLYSNSKVPVQLLVSHFTGGSKLQFVYTPTQPKPYKSFDKVPMTQQTPYMGNRELKIPGKMRQEIRQAEDGLQSTRAEGTPESYDIFDVQKSFDGESVRAYLYIVPSEEKGIPKNDPYVDVCIGVIAFYDDLGLGYWQDQIDGNYYLTREVYELFTSAGYPYLGKLKSGGQAFYNKDKRQAYVLSVADEGDSQLLEIQSIYANVKSADSSAPQLLNYKAFVRQRSEDLRRLDALTRHRVRLPRRR
ncbi:BACON domain-containing protein [uncultured Porphyromonas sp.]|uniref:BACON domain-containing protein n=1 Tax=uncultured Porphyromonas sp. TaxID=159274 RepID=UPI00262265AC|nr:BACON domain-containing protein [uncultured Porphyromonas sp.]